MSSRSTVRMAAHPETSKIFIAIRDLSLTDRLEMESKLILELATLEPNGLNMVTEKNFHSEIGQLVDKERYDPAD